MLSIGHQAPDFTALNQNSESISLSDLLEKGSLVLFFYPADFTSICTKEACMFRDMYQDLAKAGVQVVGISPQDAKSHQAFISENQLQYPLLVDQDKSIIKAYDAYGILGFVRRLTYWIDENGVIKDVIGADFRVDRHLNFVKKIIESQQAKSS
jgi:peroxiredoxin Q/BCP